MTNVKEKITSKTTKIILFASLIASVILPINDVNYVEAAIPVTLSIQEQDLVPSNILSYEAKSLDPNLLRNTISQGRDVLIDFKDKTYDLYLMEFDLRNPNAVAGIHTKEGLKTIPLEDIMTYRGYVKGDPTSNVFLLISDSMVGGFISTDNDEITIEPLSQRAKNFETNKQIIYSISDVELFIDPEGDHTELEQIREITESVNNYDVIPTASAVGWTADIILDCDTEFDDVYTNWQAQQLLVLGGVDQAFNDADDGDFSASYQFCDTGGDDYTEEAVPDRLGEFVAYWDGQGHTRDLAVLFSGNEFSGSTIGQADAINGIQNTANDAYAIAQMVDAGGSYNASLLEQKILMSHEIGHLFDCLHSYATSTTIMYTPFSDSQTLEFSSTCASHISDAADDAGIS